MHRQPYIRAIILGLAALGIGAMLWRRQAMDPAEPEEGDSFWQLQYRVTATAKKPGARLTIYLPDDTGHCRLLRQTTAHPALRIATHRGRFTGQQRIHGHAVTASTVVFDAAFDLHVSPVRRWPAPASAALTTEARAHYLRSTGSIQTTAPMIQQTLARLRVPGKKAKASQRVMKIYEFCAGQLAGEPSAGGHDAVSVLQAESGSVLGRAQAMVALCRAARLPARMVTGFELMDAAYARPHHWVEVWINGQWLPFDPANGYVGTVPSRMVPVGRDTTRIVSGVDGITDLDADFKILPRPDFARAGDRTRGQAADIVNLRRLPLSMRQTLALILLLPLGALLTAIIRSVIGVRTFGTFTPTLLALSFVYSDWRTGLLVLGVALFLAFGGRALLDRLRLLMVPRLGLMLTIVVLCMVLAVSLLDHMMLTPTAQVVLLPLVILTMIVERFFVAIEEDGWFSGLKLGGQTVAVAGCCYGLMRWEPLGEFCLTYPEVHLLSIAAFIAIGRYTGYRLSELWRFRDFIRLTTGDRI